MFLSVFDIFKIGIGPSSSHTVGPMIAANFFLQKVSSFPQVTKIKVSIHGSLAFTGKGHATDSSIILGLCGKKPDTVDPDKITEIIDKVNVKKHVDFANKLYKFNPKTDLIFDYKFDLPGHPNGMQFFAYDEIDTLVFSEVFYSVGGGFVVTEDELKQENQLIDDKNNICVPYPFATGQEMLVMAKDSGLSIAQMKAANELIFMSEVELYDKLYNIWQVMESCINRGLRMEGEIPGGLKVQRRAKKIFQKLESKKDKENFLLANDNLSLFAIAVNEENAAGGRIVTAPTNGAAGVIPAVLKFYNIFYKNTDSQKIFDFLLTAAAIGGLLKKNASISGAEVGCQGEVGSASSMAAAGLTACLGGSPQQIEFAAEVALEHHLGITCDPVAGLVQVPCIERNAMGAIKTVSASSLSLLGDGTHIVSLDACIKSMKETGEDMSCKYKETSLAGLAVNVVVC